MLLRKTMLAIAGLVTPASAGVAQISMPPPDLFIGPALSARMITPQLEAQKARSARQRGGADTSDRAASAERPRAALTFTPSAARRSANYARFVEQSRRGNPADAAGLAEMLRGDPIAAMAPALARYGLSTANVADAYAVYWVEAWQAAHGVTGESSRATAQAVKRQAADALFATPEFGKATDTQKQEFADALLVQALLIGAARDQANGDKAKLDEVAAAVRRGAKASGLDLDAMTLTDEGFVPVERTGAADPPPAAPGNASGSSGGETTDPGPAYALLAAAGGVGLGAAFLFGKSTGRKG